jgi:Domain of unknown function (DUF4332)
MASKYFIDTKNYGLVRYRNTLEKSELLPGRKILLEKIKERFESLMSHGIVSVNELAQTLKSPDKLNLLAKETKIPRDYLVILKREVGRLLPKPVSLASFPGIEKPIIAKLNQRGIKNTLQFFEHCDTRKKRILFAKEMSIPVASLEELAMLSDLSRIWGVGPIFCRIFYETGTNTVNNVANANAKLLYDKLVQVNDKGNYTRVKFTAKDVAHCIKIAGNLPKTIEL